MFYNSHLQDRCTTNLPRNADPKVKLSRLPDEMAQNRYQQNRKTRHSYSSSSEDSYDISTDEESLSTRQRTRLSSHNLRSRDVLKSNKSLNSSLKQSDNEKEKSFNRSLNRSINTSTRIVNQSINNPSLQKARKESSSTNLFNILICLFTIVAFLLLFISFFRKPTGVSDSKLNKDEILKHVETEIRALKKEFRNQEKKIWPEIYSGIIEVINNPTRPSIFVLFADRNDHMSCLALTIGELGRIAFGTEKSLKVKPTQLENDTGEVLHKLRLVIPERKSVIFWDFLSINDKALKAFHFICDRENPLIQQAIYVITVKAEGYIDSENPLEFIENKLKSNLTGRIKDDSLMPLITRITDGPIISVKPELNMQCRFKSTIDY